MIRRPLNERFASAEDLDAWFRPLVREWQTITKMLMRFEIVNAAAETREE